MWTKFCQFVVHRGTGVARFNRQRRDFQHIARIKADIHLHDGSKTTLGSSKP
ncbi:Uncharacterised protein [Vibrio cholerae]|nr:Uncharacterised protein [Vibrio cholerae]